MKKILLILVSILGSFSISVFASTIDDKIDQERRQVQDSVTQRLEKMSTSQFHTQHEKRIRKTLERRYWLKTYQRDQNNKLIAQVVWEKINNKLSGQEGRSDGEIREQRELFNTINTWRKEHHLSILRYHERVAHASFMHAQDLLSSFPYDTNGDGVKEIISHTGSNGSRVGSRLREVGYATAFAGETIAYKQTSAQEVLNDWINSPSHYDIIRSAKVKDMGISKVGPYWVAVFAREY